MTCSSHGLTVTQTLTQTLPPSPYGSVTQSGTQSTFLLATSTLSENSIEASSIASSESPSLRLEESLRTSVSTSMAEAITTSREFSKTPSQELEIPSISRQKSIHSLSQSLSFTAKQSSSISGTSSSSSKTTISSYSPSPDTILEWLSLYCPNCEIAPVSIAPNSVSTDSRVVINTLDNNVIGSLYIPPNLSSQENTSLSVNYGTDVPFGYFNQPLGDTIVEVILLDSSGGIITELDSPLTICLSLRNNTKGRDACLSFYNERKSKWECEDECLSTTGKDDGLVCGQTSHLTNFALLLRGNDAKSLCSSSRDTMWSWMSLGFVAGAVCIVLLCSLVVEARIRYRVYRKKIFVQSLNTATQIEMAATL